MLKDQKILITGATSPIAQKFAAMLAPHNEVWGVARFNRANVRTQLDGLGVKTVALDIGDGDLSALPTDFTHVLHLAYYRSPKLDVGELFRVNGAGTGHVFAHCRKAKAALYMSSHAVYNPPPEPWYAQLETDPIGSANPGFSATATVSKVAAESVAHFCAREFKLPVVITRLNTVYGNMEPVLPVMHLDDIMAGKEISLKWDPAPCTPIHIDDMCDQLEAILGAASTPAATVNWAGDEHIPAQEWCRLSAELSGRPAKTKVVPIDGQPKGTCADFSKRHALTGPCKINFADGFTRTYRERYDEAGARR